MNIKRCHFNNARCAAYILLEVMLATGIFALAGVSLAVVLEKAIGAGTGTQRETRITWNLESKLNETRLNRLSLEKETSEPDADGVVYEKEVTNPNLKNDHDESLTGLYNIKITARWKEDKRVVELVSQTYVYQP